jgi:hypothetical protein
MLGTPQICSAVMLCRGPCSQAGAACQRLSQLLLPAQATCLVWPQGFFWDIHNLSYYILVQVSSAYRACGLGAVRSKPVTCALRPGAGRSTAHAKPEQHVLRMPHDKLQLADVAASTASK